MMQHIGRPLKTRELQNHHMDSTLWNNFPFRSDDVIVASYAKSGTTWVQQIVGQLLFDGNADVRIQEISPWLEFRVMPSEAQAMLEAQKHRRIIKTHLPLDALKFSPRAKYIYVARDGRDVAWSLHHHHLNANQHYYDLANNTPGRVGPPFDRPDRDVCTYFRRWLAKDGAPIWSFWESVSTWWAARGMPNILLVHHNDLKADLSAEARRIADFLEIEIAESVWPAIMEHCSLNFMRSNAAGIVPLGGVVFEGGARTFLNKGVNGRWRDLLTAADIADYDRMARDRLGDECSHWLACGSRAEAPPLAMRM